MSIFRPFEPKVTFRYTLNIMGIPAFTCKAAGMPELDNGEIVIDYINTDFKVKGKSRWQDVSVTLYDPVDPSAADAVMNWILLHHNSVNGQDGYAFTEYKQDITIEALDPHGFPVESWTMFGAFIGDVNWGDMDWTAEDAKEIELTIKYDFAVLTPMGGAGIDLGPGPMAFGQTASSLPNII